MRFERFQGSLQQLLLIPLTHHVPKQHLHLLLQSLEFTRLAQTTRTLRDQCRFRTTPTRLWQIGAVGGILLL